MTTSTDDRPDLSGKLDFGYPSLTVRTSWFSGRLPGRLLGVAAVLLLVATALAAGSLLIGKYPMEWDQIVATLTGHGEDKDRMVLLEWRLPVIVAALVFGALLGIGGAIFQSLTRNPLGSPDIIGFDAGSFTAVTVTILLLGSKEYWSIAGAALAGGLVTALVVYLLAYRNGIQGFRLIIVGIGVTAVLGSANAYLITRAEVHEAMVVGFWGAGSIGRVTWTSLVPSLALAAAIVLACAALAAPLRQMELGDDAAHTQGISVGRDRLLLIVSGVATSALVTAAAGPIGFIALVAPQLARRLTRAAGVSLLGSAAMGCFLLAAAHFLSVTIAQFYREIPVGLITVCLGGLYLIWLLVREARQAYQL